MEGSLKEKPQLSADRLNCNLITISSELKCVTILFKDKYLYTERQSVRPPQLHFRINSKDYERTGAASPRKILNYTHVCLS